MKTALLIASIASALFISLPAQAQQGPGSEMGGAMGPGSGPCSAGQNCPGGGPGAMKGGRMGSGAMMDCSKARQPERCEARNQAMEQCKDQTGPARRQCMREKMPPVDCSKARVPARCEAAQKAREACKDKVGPEMRSCMRAQTAKPAAAKPEQKAPAAK